MIVKEKLYHDLESIFELDPGTISGDESLDEFNWDSMALVMFIAIADQNYSVAIEPSKLVSAKTVADLYSLVANIS